MKWFCDKLNKCSYMPFALEHESNFRFFHHTSQKKAKMNEKKKIKMKTKHKNNIFSTIIIINLIFLCASAI